MPNLTFSLDRSNGWQDFTLEETGWSYSSCKRLKSLTVSLLSLEKLTQDLKCIGTVLNVLQMFILFVLIAMF